MKRILIINVYSYKNRGDSGIVKSMLAYIERSFGINTRIYLMSPYSEQNKKFYDSERISSIPDATSKVKNKKILFKYIVLLSKFLFVDKKTLNQFKKADLIFSAGGGYIYSSRKGPLGFGLLNVLLNIHYAKLSNKPVIIFPISVGPIRHKLDKLIVQKFLKGVTHIFVREEQSKSILREMGIVKNVELCPDIAFTLNKSKFHLKEIHKGNALNIGVSVLDWRFSRPKSTLDDIDLYLEKIATALKKSKFNHKVYIFPQVDVSDNDTDRFVSEKLQKIIGKKSKVILLNHIFNPEDVLSLYSKMDLFIGSRMHSCIFSITAKVPTICLAYQFKSKGTFEVLGVEEDCFDIENITILELLKSIEHKIEHLKLNKSDINNIISLTQDNIYQKLNAYFEQ